MVWFLCVSLPSSFPLPHGTPTPPLAALPRLLEPPLFMEPSATWDQGGPSCPSGVGLSRDWDSECVSLEALTLLVLVSYTLTPFFMYILRYILV